jgi:hypothetical protein
MKVKVIAIREALCASRHGLALLGACPSNRIFLDEERAS